MPPRVGAVADVLVLTYESWRDDRCIRLGAGLAYYGMFAIAPLLTLAVALAGLVFSAPEVQEFLAEPLARLFGEDVDVVTARLAELVADGRQVAQLGLVGLVSLVVAASLVFVAFQDALNQIWHVPYEAGLRQTIRRRLLSFGVVLVTGGLLVASLAAQAVVGLLGGFVPLDGGVVTLVTNLASGLLPVLLAALAVALLFRLLPHATVDRRAALVGGAVTAVLMAVALVAVGWYLGTVATSSASGAAGSVFVVLTAIYVQSQVVLAGAELTKVLTRRWQ